MRNKAVAGLRQPCFIILYFNCLQSSVLNSRTENAKKVGRKSSNSREKNKNSKEKILELLREDPRLTTAGLAQALGISAKGVEKQLANLKREGLLHRLGPDKGGHWEVINLSQA